MSKINDTWNSLRGKIGHYGVQLLEVVGSSPTRWRNWQGDDSGHAYVDAKTRSSGKIAYHATIPSDIDLTGSGDGYCRRLIVGGSEALVVTVGGENVTIAKEVIDAFPVLDIEATAIVASGTSATKILVMW